MASTSEIATVTSAPSIEDLSELISSSGPASQPIRLPHAKERLFGSDTEPRLIFYRDNSSWCPYCQRVWLQLEEKQVPYRVEKINMRCYGPKPDWYTKMVPSGLLPAVKIDGQLITESLDIMIAIETTFTDYRSLLPPKGSAQFADLSPLLRLERKFMGAWLQWITSPWDNGKTFQKTLQEVEVALSKYSGPFFLGEEFSMMDAVWAPFLERAAASVPYWKGYAVRGRSDLPAVNKWFDAMDTLPTYQAMKSDDFTITHCLEPQIGQCYPSKEGERYRALVDGTNDSWHLPLKPETTAWGFDDGTGQNGARLEAARSLVENHDAVVRFSLRGTKNGENYVDSVSQGFRWAAFALLSDANDVRPVGGFPKEVAAAAAYLRDKVGVPRDLTYPAARQLRAHLNWLIQQVK